MKNILTKSLLLLVCIMISISVFSGFIFTASAETLSTQATQENIASKDSREIAKAIPNLDFLIDNLSIEK